MFVELCTYIIPNVFSGVQTQQLEQQLLTRKRLISAPSGNEQTADYRSTWYALKSLLFSASGDVSSELQLSGLHHSA